MNLTPPPRLPGFTPTLHALSVMRKLMSKLQKLTVELGGVFHKEPPPPRLFLIGQNSLKGFVHFFSLPVFMDMQICQYCQSLELKAPLLWQQRSFTIV